MMSQDFASGINLVSLQEAFDGSEEVLAQMLGLFQVQAVERMGQLNAHLAAWDTTCARTALHSLINISGAVRAYAMSELAKAVGEAVKREDRELAQTTARVLGQETERVLAMVKAMLDAARQNPLEIWNVPLVGLGHGITP
jgi:HPt (histidine-containing phosphotransfer) domain-containing protein